MSKKIIAKTITFTVIFIIVSSFLSDIFIFKSREKLEDSKRHLISMPKDSVDVLFLGASGLYAGVSPINLWNDYGITSFSLASSNQPPIITYYTFLEALKYQKPKLIVVDFVSLTVDNSPKRFEAYYQRGLSGIIDFRTKFQAVWTIDHEFEITSKLSYLSPLYRYHHRWSELEKGDFIDVNPYKDYTLGGFMNDRITHVDFSDDFMDEDAKMQTINGISEKYYQKIVDTALANGIDVLSVSPPRVETDYGKYLAIKDFCEMNQINYIDYNLDENLEELDLDLKRDFYDINHLNKHGNIKMTHHLGKYMVEEFALENKKNLKEYDLWLEMYAQYANNTQIQKKQNQ